MLRVLTAAGLVALLAVVLYLPPPAFSALVVALVLLGWREFAGLAAVAGATPVRGLGPLLAVACALAFHLPDPRGPVAVLGLAAVLAAAFSLAAGRRHPGLAVRKAMATFGGCCWLGLLAGFQVALRQGPEGVWWIVFLVATVSSGDIAAYYGGRLLGRRPLAPKLSPGKTVEGAVAGLGASLAAASLVATGWLPGLGPVRAGGLGLLLGMVGQAGDLFESGLKRAAGVKDASGLLPGHGGVLDRIDGLLFAGAVLYAALAYPLLP